jgi:hypothetical protein
MNLGRGALLVALLPLLGCNSDDPVADPDASSTSSTERSPRVEAADDALYQLLVSLLPGACPTTTTTAPTASGEFTIEDLLDALGLQTLPPPVCIPTTEATP